MRLVASAVVRPLPSYTQTYAPSGFLPLQALCCYTRTALTYYLPTYRPTTFLPHIHYYLPPRTLSLLLRTLARAPLAQSPFTRCTDGQRQHAPDKALRVPCSKLAH